MWSDILLFSASLAALLLSARFFTGGAEKIGRYFRLSPFVIGLFIIGIGTSLPELVSAIFSIKKGVPEIIPGNILGANIANILLILGLTAALSPSGIALSKRYVMIDLHYLIGTALLFVLAIYDGILSRGEGLALLSAFFIHSLYVLRSGEMPRREEAKTKNPKPFPLNGALIMVLAAAGIYFAGDFTVTALKRMATSLQLSPALVSLTLLSLGTTLPELVVSLLLVKEKKSEEAVGNVLGSCIFNVTVIPGVATLPGQLQVPAELLALSPAIFLGASLFFYLLTQDKRISHWEGMLFLLFYLVFILKTAALI
jgi:cation:H+ antiporter